MGDPFIGIRRPADARITIGINNITRSSADIPPRDRNVAIADDIGIVNRKRAARLGRYRLILVIIVRPEGNADAVFKHGDIVPFFVFLRLIDSFQ